jgi:NiFe hydrogenase small subunit HydA
MAVQGHGNSPRRRIPRGVSESHPDRAPGADSSPPDREFTPSPNGLDPLGGRLLASGVDRRRFLSWAARITAVLALPPTFAPRVAHAVEKAAKPTLIWFEFQDCTGDTESFLRSRNPGVGDLILDVVSVDYHETIMAGSGQAAEKSLAEAVAAGGHIVVVEGSVPLGADGAYCVIAGKSAKQHLEEATKGALAVINVGSCSAYGGLPAAAPTRPARSPSRRSSRACRSSTCPVARPTPTTSRPRSSTI